MAVNPDCQEKIWTIQLRYRGRKMQRCLHSLLPGQCAQCQPKVYESIVDEGRAAGEEGEYPEGFVCITAERNHPSHKNLHFTRTRTVHINGIPHLWLLHEIYERARNVQVIQVIPSMLQPQYIKASHQKFCDERGIKLKAGHAHPELAWDKGERRPTAEFIGEQKFMKNLHPEQQRYFDELRTFQFDAAEMAALHYQLDDGEFVPQWKIGQMYGQRQVSAVSAYILAVVHYLDPSFPVIERSETMAANMLRRVIRLREYFVSEQALKGLAARLNLPHLPAGLPPSRIELLEQLIEARDSGDLSRLQRQHPRLYEILMFRYGLEGAEPSTYRSLRVMGEMHGISHERIRQLEVAALHKLSITDDEAGDVRKSELAGIYGATNLQLLPEVEIDTWESRDNREQILQAVMKEFGVSREELLSETRQQPIARVRQVMMYLLREMLGMSWTRIGAFINDRDHTTIMRSHARIQDIMATDAELRIRVEKVEKAIQSEASEPSAPRAPRARVQRTSVEKAPGQRGRADGTTASMVSTGKHMDDDQLSNALISVCGYYGVTVSMIRGSKRDDRLSMIRGMFAHLLAQDYDVSLACLADFLFLSVPIVTALRQTVAKSLEGRPNIKEDARKLRERLQGVLPKVDA